MKATFILKNYSEEFYKKLSLVNTQDVFNFMKANGITPLVGNDTLNDRIAFNVLFKNGGVFSNMEIGKRKGYNLLTIELN